MSKGKGGTTLDPATENQARDGREEDRDNRELERV
jgi:MHS family alpha-ketoglutarate permease-like MFS transporter